MRKTVHLKPIARAMLACSMSVVLVLGLTPAMGFAVPSYDASPMLAAAESDLDSSTSIDSWSALQETIRSATPGSTIKLTQTLTATANDSYLDIPYGSKLTIDLAGWTLNRNLAEASSDGAVIKVNRDAELTLVNTGGTATIKGGNNSYDDGGGIINQGTLVIGGKDDQAAIRITYNKAAFGAGIFNMGAATINGATVDHNEANSSGGGIYNQGGELTITDATISNNSADASGGGIYNNGTVTIDGATISYCSAKDNGGAICNAGTLTVEYGTISANYADMGGAICVASRGKTTIEDVVVTNNSATKDGGGAYVETTGTLTLGYAPSINTNTAGANNHGGGIYVKGNLKLTGGRPTVSNNKRSNSAADNIYLPGSKKIEVAGHLSGGKLAVTLAGGAGQVTQGFGAQGNAMATSFKGDNLYAVVNNGEVWLQAEEQQRVFMDPNQYPLRHYPKPSEVDATNWMAAIPDDWLISEFNIPYSHDSATKNISPYNVIGNTGVQLIKGRGWSFAVTQVHTIPEQLNMGVRCLDVRLNNEYPHNGTTVSVETADDGHSLWICHGKSTSGGTYYAYDDDGNRISFEKVLNYAKSFLTDHPTETITILLTAETQWPKKNSAKIWARARKHLEALSTTINRSTGKSFLYCEEGQGFFNTYNHFPRLGDCRGQIVIQYDPSYEYSEDAHLYVGGMQGLRDVDSQWPNGVTWKREKGGNGVSASDKIDNINEFIGSVEWYSIARDVTTHRNHFYFMSPSTHVESIMSYITLSDQPYKIAEEVNKEFFDMYGAFFNQRGTYVGWVKLDGIKERYARLIWQSNFPEDDNFLDYCNITVKSGQDPHQFPDQFYGPIVKGCTITLPECIYNYDPGVHGEFLGWEVQKSKFDDKQLMYPGDTYIVDVDTTITAKWGKINYDRLQVYLDLGASDASPGPGQSNIFMCTAGEKLNMTKMNKATRDGYELDGWYNADGVKITESTRLRQSLCDKDGNGAVIMTEPDSQGFTHQRITLTARWTSTKTPATIVNAPAAKDLTYTGYPQQLVTAGSATGGTLVYALGGNGASAPSDGAFGVAIPEGTNVGTYYVWYKAVGDEGHDDTEVRCVTATITIKEHVHTPGSAQHENEVAATCTDEGSYDEVVRCAVCGEVISSTPVTVPALGHDWSEWTVVEAATEGHDGLQIRTCKRCTEEQIEVIPAPAHVHRAIPVSAIEPHCVSSGTKAHYECTCGKWFSDSAAKTEISPASCSVQATGHTALDKIVPERTNEVPATCTESGSHRDIYRCEKCAQVLNVVHVIDAPKGHTWIVDETTNEYGWRASRTGSTIYEDRECSACGFTETRSYEIGHEHDTQIFPEVPATCDQPGIKEHDVCRICGQVFLYNTDTSRLEETTEDKLVIPALGHDWGKPEYTWSSDGDTVTATCTCRNPEHVVLETAAVTPLVKEATCTEAGEITYTATFVSEAFTPQVRTETIPALGHDWSEWTVTKEPTCEQAGIETRTCKNDPAHVETNEIASLGHDWSEWTVTKEPTETAEGEETRTCSRCGKVETRSIPMKGVVSYREVSGDGAVWIKGSNASLSFTFERSVDDNETFNHFTGIQVDDVDVGESDYTAEPGSVVVTLPPDYLETLSVDEHVLTALFDDAAAAPATFKVVTRSGGGTDPNDDTSGSGNDTSGSGGGSGGSGGGSGTNTADDGKSGGTKSTPKPTSPKESSAVAKTGDNLQTTLTVTFSLLLASALALVGLAAIRRIAR